MEVFVVLLVVVVSFGAASDLQREWTGCYSPQYVEIGETGYIHCQFPNEFNAIYWYDNAMDKSAVPVVSYSNSLKAGSKYENGEYDIITNGSLVISNVTVYHEGNFKVVCIDRGELSRSFIVSVQTTVTPKPSQTTVEGCNPGETRCLLNRKDIEALTCTCKGSRPPVQLQWFERLPSYDRDIESSTKVIEDGVVTFTTVSNVSLSFAVDRFVVVIVCTLLNLPSGFSRAIEVVLDMTESSDVFSLGPQVTPFPVESKAIFECSDRDKKGNYIWKKQYNTVSEVVASSIMGQTFFVTDGFTITAFGDLIIESARIDHEGNYTCFYDIRERKSVTGITLFVAVPPTNPYISIDECKNEATCIIDASFQGRLTCSVSGIRPPVFLVWLKSDEDEIIRFKEEKESVVTENQLYTVSRTLFYAFQDVACHGRATLFCRAEGMGTRYLATSTAKVTLVAGNVCQGERSRSVKHVVLPVIATLLITFTVVAVVVIVRCLTKSRNSLRAKQKSYEEDDGERVPLKVDAANNIFRSNFISHLRKLYGLIVVKQNVYVFNEFSKMDPSKISSDDTRFTSLGSYQQLFGEDLTSKGRIVIEGEAGCGKSIFALQMAKEWSHQTKGSPLNNFPIFILLSLTEFVANTTIYEAIRDQILPEDFIEEISDLKTMLREESKYILFLDGFDEFSERNNEDLGKSDLYKILHLRGMSNAVIYILTRSVSYLRVFGDKQYPIVRLEPFTSKQINQYLDYKFNNDEEIRDDFKRGLRENDYLESLCHIPLFLNMLTEQSFITELKHFSIGKMTTFIRELLKFKYNSYEQKLNNCQNQYNVDQPSIQMTKFAFDALKTKKNVYTVNSLHAVCTPEEITAMIAMNIFTEERKELNQSHTRVVKFTHNVYQYYYAAQFVASIEGDSNVKSSVEKIDVLTSDYVFIFACGLNFKVARGVVSYLLELDDIYPYPISDCICNCLNEISIEQMGEFKDLLSALCKKEHGMELRFTDRKFLTTAKMSLLHACQKMTIPVNILRLTNAVSHIEGAFLHLGGNNIVPIPKVHTCIITDYNQELNENHVLSLIISVPELEELVIFSYFKPRRVKDEVTKCLKERTEKGKTTLVAWFTFDDLGEDSRVYFSYPSTTFGCWVTPIETAVVTMIDKPEEALKMVENSKLKAIVSKTLLKHKGFLKINAEQAIKIMKNKGLSEYFRQIGFSKTIEKLFLSELEKINDFGKDILRLWQKLDDSSNEKDVKYYSRLLRNKMEKDIPPSFRNALKAANESTSQQKHKTESEDGVWQKGKQNIVTFVKPVFFSFQV